MKIRYILSLLTVAFLLGSCATPKVAYFTDLKRGTAEQVLNPLEIRIRPEDKISIQVNSKDPLLMNLFNLPIISRQIGTTSGTSNSQGISGYTINKDGDIDFPVLGHIHVAGMTRAEIASYIKEELVSKNLVKDRSEERRVGKECRSRCSVGRGCDPRTFQYRKGQADTFGGLKHGRGPYRLWETGKRAGTTGGKREKNPVSGQPEFGI